MEDIVWLVEWVAWKMPRRLLTRQALQMKRMFLALKGNARVLVIANLFWTIPASFTGVYLQLYMAEQGLSKIEIGSIASAQVATQMIGALCGGWLAYRFGRLRTIVAVDSVSYTHLTLPTNREV